MPKSRDKNRTGKGNQSPLKEIAISAGLGAGGMLILLVIFALVMSAQDVPGKLTPIMVTAVLVIGSLMAGYRCGRRLRQNGMMNGALTGGLMYLVLLAVALVKPGNEVGIAALYKVLMMVTGGAVGCVLAVNRREKVKTIRPKHR